ncbi:MAG: methionyl-tRNA formyltransferase [Candidatus Kapabacteria bacterium]|nr:methionyl-tRNA formyltransferase [Candidatus Kapabacteria bacterium]
MNNTTQTKPRVMFMGTPDFAVPALEALHNSIGVDAVVTLPDAATGRGLKLHPTAVKSAAERLGIGTLLQPASLKSDEFTDAVRGLAPDILCVIAFRILPHAVYSLARLGAFNVHASLLPKYRGAAPINHAIINGERESGVTSFLLNDVVDTGNLLMQKHIPVPDGATAGDLYALLMPLAAACAVETCHGLIAGTLLPMQQNDTLATPAPKVWREKAGVDWRESATTVRNFIHGMSPAPCAWTEFMEGKLKIHRAAYHNGASLALGEWQMTDIEWLAGTGDGTLSLTQVQLPGKPVMNTPDLLRGWRGMRSGVFPHHANM